MKGTIKSSREIDELFSQAQRASNKYVVTLTRTTPEGRGPRGRVAFIAGKKVGNATARNRAKRVLREAVAAAGGPWPGWDAVFVARPPVLAATPEDIRRSIDGALKRLGVTA